MYKRQGRGLRQRDPGQGRPDRLPQRAAPGAGERQLGRGDVYKRQTLESPDAPPPTGDESARVTFYLTADEAGFSQLAAARVALSDFRKAHTDCGTLLMTLDAVSYTHLATGPTPSGGSGPSTTAARSSGSPAVPAEGRFSRNPYPYRNQFSPFGGNCL